MATLYIAECADFANWGTGDRVKAIGLPPVMNQALPLTGASAQSAVFGPTTKVVRVVADVACAIVAGQNPTAAVTDMYLPANVPEYFAVNPLDRIAAITVTP